MKKALSLILAMTLLFAMALPAAAAGQTTTLTINYESDAYYELIIPTDQVVQPGGHHKINTMVELGETRNLWGQHIDVECQISDFVGENHQKAYTGYLAALPAEFDTLEDEGAFLTGNGHSGYTDDNGTYAASPLLLRFQNVQEDGSCLNTAVTPAANENDETVWINVGSLWEACFLNNLGAPSDTYKATITYKASLNPND